MDPTSLKVAKKFTTPVNVARRFIALRRSHDVLEAVEYYMASYISEPDGELCFTSKTKKMPLRSILRWDDYSAWGEFDKGQLKGLPPGKAEKELASFRGRAWASRAMKWLAEGKIPPIVVVDGFLAQCIGDGRGRVNLAMAFNLQDLDAIVLKQTEGQGHCFAFRNFELER